MIEQLIFSNLVYNEEYCRKAMPFLEESYFGGDGERVFLDTFKNYLNKYNVRPTTDALRLELSNRKGLTQNQYEESMKIIDAIQPSNDNVQWVIDKTETFCQEKAIYNAILESLEIIEKKSKTLSTGSIPKLLSDALAVSFDKDIGHDFLEDYEQRFDFYHSREEKLEFDLEYLNKITKGGVSKKSLTVILAGCVHPSTPVKIRYCSAQYDWHEVECQIGYIKKLFKEDQAKIEIDSPDGWVSVNYFIEKGMYREYVLNMDGNRTPIKCNAEHLFQTRNGWVSAVDMYQLQDAKGIETIDVLTRDGWVPAFVTTSDKYIPIVDINVEHENHRYYTGDVSSHNTGVGKSLMMCHFAASNLVKGKNVLYITLEMSEERIAERIDANLLDIDIAELENVPKESYLKKIERVRSKTIGKLIVKEFPTASAGSANFRHLLNELRIKKNFIPDVLYIDYLNICASSRMKMGPSVNSYTYIKAIAEELRGLGIEFNIPVITATQTNRQGYGNSDVELTDTSESFGLPQTADLMFAVIASDEMAALNQVMVKQLKNRYAPTEFHKRFVVGIDKSRMRLYDVEESAQNLSAEPDQAPAFDKTEFGKRANADGGDRKSKFSELKF